MSLVLLAPSRLQVAIPFVCFGYLITGVNKMYEFWSQLIVDRMKEADRLQEQNKLLASLLGEVKEACLYVDDGDLGACVSEDVVITSDLFDRIIRALEETKND